MSGSKVYIGKGKKNANYNIVDVVLQMEEAEKHIFEYEGKKYMKFSVAERQSPDQYGNTHTVSVFVPEAAAAVEEPAPKKPARKPRKKAAAKK